MTLNLCVLKEADGESRVAATPDTIKKYIASGCNVTVETNAGINAGLPDTAFETAGARIAKNADDALKNANVVFCVARPTQNILDKLPEHAVLMGMLTPYTLADDLKSFQKNKTTAIAMELVPRISRAQSMDVLSSQANLAGYRAVIEATHVYKRAFPMMMTAAGTVAPAKVFVMGAGVAGLQAIATAKRLGAVVSATDVRAAAKEQVQSLGGSFVMVENEETKEAETAGGYAKEMSDDYKRQQAELIADTIKKQDIVITTALIPGRPAPVLVTEDMVKSMRPGSVIIDMAVEQGGNCPLSEQGKIVQKHNVNIVGYADLASRIGTDTSALYAKNLLNVFNLLFDKDNEKLNFNMEDEIIKGITMIQDGRPIHPLLSPSPKTDTAEKPSFKRGTPDNDQEEEKKEA